MKELLALKKKIAKKRSYYVRSDAHKRVCIPLKWRTPRGCHNKIRLKKRGKVSHPNPGVASPRAVRGMTRHGLRPIQVETLKQLESINLKTECALINNVGKKKRIELLKHAISKKIMVLNFKNPESAIQQIEEARSKKQESSKKKKDEQKKKKEESVKKEEDKKKKDENTEKPETAKGSKSEKIKTLEKRQ